MTIVARLAVAAFIAAAIAAPATARFARVPAQQVDEVPVERVMANVKRNAQNLPPVDQWRIIGRAHLLARN
jgi:hypothetical protein